MQATRNEEYKDAHFSHNMNITLNQL